MRKILCWLGLHKWYLDGHPYISPIGNKSRYCVRCGREQDVLTDGPFGVYWYTSA